MVILLLTNTACAFSCCQSSCGCALGEKHPANAPLQKVKAGKIRVAGALYICRHSPAIAAAPLYSSTAHYTMSATPRSILGNGLPYGIGFFALSFLIGHYSFGLPLPRSVPVSALIGAAAWLANGLLYKRINAPRRQLDSLTIQLQGAEQLLRQAPANHTIEDNLMPGKLFLTDRRLIFRPIKTGGAGPPKYSWDLDEHAWALDSLEPLAFSKSLWNTGGGFTLMAEGDVVLRFEVEDLRGWKRGLGR